MKDAISVSKIRIKRSLLYKANFHEIPKLPNKILKIKLPKIQPESIKNTPISHNFNQFSTKQEFSNIDPNSQFTQTISLRNYTQDISEQQILANLHQKIKSEIPFSVFSHGNLGVKFRKNPSSLPFKENPLEFNKRKYFSTRGSLDSHESLMKNSERFLMQSPINFQIGKNAENSPKNEYSDNEKPILKVRIKRKLSKLVMERREKRSRRKEKISLEPSIHAILKRKPSLIAEFELDEMNNKCSSGTQI